MMFQKIAIGLVAIIAAIVGIACGGDNCGNMCDPEWVKSATLADYQAELDDGADPNADDGQPLRLALSPFSTSVTHGVVQLLVDSGADPNGPEGSSLFTPLVLAVIGGSAATVEILLKAGADPNEGNHPLARAAYTAKEEFESIASLLIAYGADIDAIDTAGAAPLHYAVLNDEEKHVSFLLDNGADTNVVTSINGDTPLHWAAGDATSDSYSIVRLLIQHGARKDIVNDDNKTPCQSIYLDADVGSSFDEREEIRERFSALLC